MRIIVIGDIHGRDVWKDIVEREYDRSDLIIFLGDYVSSHEGIPSVIQYDNFMDILDFKESSGDKVVLLRGNHDMQHLGYSWAECSNLDVYIQSSMIRMRDRILYDTQWIETVENIIFSHAGVSSVWLNEIAKCRLDQINNLPPSPIFGFWPDNKYDRSGTSVTQPCTWIRPESLLKVMIPMYDQVVGHTVVRKIISEPDRKGSRLYLADCLTYVDSYLEINDGEFISHYIR